MNQSEALNIAQRTLGRKTFAAADSVVVDANRNIYVNSTPEVINTNCDGAKTFVVKGVVDLTKPKK